MGGMVHFDSSGLGELSWWEKLATGAFMK